MNTERISVKSIRSEHHTRLSSTMTERAKKSKLDVEELNDDD